MASILARNISSKLLAAPGRAVSSSIQAVCRSPKQTIHRSFASSAVVQEEKEASLIVDESCVQVGYNFTLYIIT